MRKVGPREYEQILRSRGIPTTRRALGDYGNGEPVYSDREVFRGEPGAGSAVGNGGVYATVEPISVQRNRIFFSVTPFSLSSGDGSTQLLTSNELRRFLTVQNQSTTDLMYVNFSNEAAANVGIELYPAQALVYDQVVPYNSIQIFVNVATKQRGVVVEGALQL